MTIALMPMQWADFEDIDDVEPLNETDETCLSEIRDVLRKHGMMDRFGVALLHKHLDLKDDEILLETTDEQNRKLILEPTSREEAGKGNVGTIFALREGDFETMAWCDTYCKQKFLRDGIPGHSERHRTVKD